MIAVTERRSVLALDDDQRVSITDGRVVVDQRIAPHLFIKIAEVPAIIARGGLTTIEFPFGVVDAADGEVHFGRVRIAGSLVMIYEGEENSKCCPDGRVLFVPIREIQRITRFRSAETLGEVSRDFRPVGDLRAGPEVR